MANDFCLERVRSVCWPLKKAVPLGRSKSPFAEAFILTQLISFKRDEHADSTDGKCHRHSLLLGYVLLTTPECEGYLGFSTWTWA